MIIDNTNFTYELIETLIIEDKLNDHRTWFLKTVDLYLNNMLPKNLFDKYKLLYFKVKGGDSG